MGSKPIYYHAAQSRLRQDIPDRLAFTRSAAYRPNTIAIRRGFDESENVVFIGALAGRNRRPEHRRKNWLQGRDLAADAAFDELFEDGHFARFH